MMAAHRQRDSRNSRKNKTHRSMPCDRNEQFAAHEDGNRQPSHCSNRVFLPTLLLFTAAAPLQLLLGVKAQHGWPFNLFHDLQSAHGYITSPQRTACDTKCVTDLNLSVHRETRAQKHRRFSQGMTTIRPSTCTHINSDKRSHQSFPS